MSTVDPIEAALAGQTPDASGTGDAPPEDGAAPVDHPALARYDGDVQKALDAFQELNSTFGQEGHRLGQENAALRQQLAELQQGQQQPAAPPEQGTGLPDLDVDQVNEWFMEKPADAMAYMMEMNNQILRDQIRSEYDERFKPVEQTTNRVAGARLSENLATEVGVDVVKRNEAAINAITSSDGFYKNTPETQFNMLKTVVAAAEWDREHTTQRGASQDGGAATKNVAVEGGSQGRTPQSNETPTPIDGFLKELGSPGTKKGLFGLDIAAE